MSTTVGRCRSLSRPNSARLVVTVVKRKSSAAR
jgi:hypothetical protein